MQFMQWYLVYGKHIISHLQIEDICIITLQLQEALHGNWFLENASVVADLEQMAVPFLPRRLRVTRLSYLHATEHHVLLWSTFLTQLNPKAAASFTGNNERPVCSWWRSDGAELKQKFRLVLVSVAVFCTAQDVKLHVTQSSNKTAAQIIQCNEGECVIKYSLLDLSSLVCKSSGTPSQMTWHVKKFILYTLLSI